MLLLSEMSTAKQPGGLEPTKSSSKLTCHRGCGYSGPRECGGVFCFTFSGDGCARWSVSCLPGEEVGMKFLIFCEIEFHLSGRTIGLTLLDNLSPPSGSEWDRGKI